MSEEVFELNFSATGEFAQEFKNLCDDCGVTTDAVLYNYMKRVVFSNEIVMAGTKKKTAESVSSKVTELIFFSQTDPANVVEAVKDEDPYLIALLLGAFNNPVKAAVIMQNLPEEKMGAVGEILAKGVSTDENLVRGVALYFQKKIESSLSSDRVVSGGVDFVVEVANLMDRAAEKKLIEDLEERNEDIAEEIKKRMFVFEDIVVLDDRAIQKTLREVDNQELAKALKNQKDDVRDKIFRNMSKRACSMLMEDIEFMGPVRLKDVEEAQQKIVSIIRRLEDCGEIIIARSPESEMIV